MNYPAMHDKITPAILKVLTITELMVLAERFGPRQIAARMGVNLDDAIREAAARGKQHN